LHQGDGCDNDGYVQFCAPGGNKRVRAAIKRIAPTAEKRSERHCDEKESLFFLPVEVDLGSCVERGGAMTDKAWNQVCLVGCAAAICRRSFATAGPAGAERDHLCAGPTNRWSVTRATSFTAPARATAFARSVADSTVPERVTTLPSVSTCTRSGSNPLLASSLLTLVVIQLSWLPAATLSPASETFSPALSAAPTAA